MRLAETARVRTLIVISSLGLAGVIAAWLMQPEPAPRARTSLRPMRGCAQRVVVPPAVVKPAPPPPARTHSEQIHALRQELVRCTDGGPEATLTIWLRRDGTVRQLELDGDLGARPEAFRACMNAVVKPALFPPADTEMRVDVLLKHD